MFDLTKLSVGYITNEFNAAIDGKAMGRLSPRNGYYHVIAFEFRDVNKRSQVPIIRAHWKTDSQDPFLEDVVFEIALSSLEAANKNHRFDYTNIVGKTFQVFNMSLSKTDEYPEGRLQGQWLYEIMPHKIISESDLHLSLISLVASPDGVVTVKGDEEIDYNEEANRLDDPANYFPDNEDWSGFDDETSIDQ